MELFEGYIRIDELAKKWGVTPRSVQLMCAKGKIEGAERFGREWMVPKNTKKPPDGRTKAGRETTEERISINLPLPRKTPFLHMTDLYSIPGTADECIRKVSGNHEAKILIETAIAYSRGEIDRVYDSSKYLLQKHSGLYAVIAAGMTLALCAIWKGDLDMWRQAKIHISEAPAKTDEERDIIALSLTAVDSMLYDITLFPDWFRMGRFEPLHPDALPAVKVFYAKYLYAIGFAVATKESEFRGAQGLSLMTMVPFAVEPMISQAKADNSLICEIYLRLTCAAVYHVIGNTQQMFYHIDRAVSLALPDRLYGLLAEYCRVFDGILEKRISLQDEAAVRIVGQLSKAYSTGWNKLSGMVRGKNLITTLSPKQREVAKLASFGFRNDEIAKRLNMSVSAVKQSITNIINKTGVQREEFAAFL